MSTEELHDRAELLAEVCDFHGLLGFDVATCIEIFKEGARWDAPLKYLIAFSGELGGGSAKLDRASAWRPGCIAFSKEGPLEVYRAAGGTYQAGAQRWSPIFIQTGEAQFLVEKEVACS